MDISDSDRTLLEKVIVSHYYHLFKNEEASKEDAIRFLTLFSMAVKSTRKSSGFPKDFEDYLTDIFLMIETRYRDTFTENQEIGRNFFAITNTLEDKIEETIKNHLIENGVLEQANCGNEATAQQNDTESK